MRSTPSRAIAFAIVQLILAAFVAGSASAQDAGAQAESLFNEAKKLMAAGKLAEACEAFAASEKMDGAASTLMNLADCREKNQQYASAWEAYVSVQRRVAGDGKYGRMADIAGAHAAALEPRLSYLTINVSDDVRVEGLEVTRDGVPIAPGAWNKSLPVDGGTHTISGRAPGVEPWSTTVTLEPESDKKSVEVPKFKAIRNPTGKTVIIEHKQASTFTPRRKIAVGVAGVGVAAVVTGVAFGLASNRSADRASSLCPQVNCDSFEQANQYNQQSRDRALYANIGFGVAGAAVAGAVVLWVIGRPSEPADQPTLEAHVGSRQATASVSFHF